MKRRTFVQSALLGAAGLGLQPGLLPFSLSFNQGALQWMNSLITATGAKWRMSASAAPESFQDVTTQLNQYFAQRGYTASNFGCHFYGPQANACFYPVKLRHQSSGILDLLVPVLALQSDGTWRHIFTLTSFQLEALAQAAQALQEQPLPLQQLLLPDPSGRTLADGFNSALAQVSFKTLVQQNNTQTAITICHQHQVLYQKTFASNHCLIAGKSIV